MGNKINGQELQVIECPMVSGNIRTLEACKKCEFFVSTREVRPAGQMKSEKLPEGLPATHQVSCRLPRGIMIKALIMEEDMAGGVNGSS